MPHILNIRKHILTHENWKLYAEYAGENVTKVRIEEYGHYGSLVSVYFLMPGDEVGAIIGVPLEIASAADALIGSGD